MGLSQRNVRFELPRCVDMRDGIERLKERDLLSEASPKSNILSSTSSASTTDD